jgi:aldehyde dehydrogenase
MSNPWLALEFGADPAERIGQIGRAHERFIAGGPVPAQVRGVVGESWRRSAGARVNPDATAPIELADDDLEAYRGAHLLAPVLPVFRDLLDGIAEDGAHIMAICDARGRLLWVEGHPRVLRHAEAMNFVAGAWWDEAHAGTNAPGTALAVDHSVQIFATEHFSRQVQPWTCAAAPIHDPVTGRLLGAIDVTGGDHLANPHSLALVQATARAAEACLLAGLGATARSARTAVSVLGRDDALLSVNGQRIRLGRRHSELLVLLLCHPEGRTGDQLGLDLYGDEALNPVTLRAELSRLRRTLGPALLEANLEQLAVAETWENGKPVRETLAADIPLAIDHFRYFAGAIRAQEGSLGTLDDDTVAYHFHEPLGVVGQIIPWNFPLLMATWKLAPALAAGNAVVLKPAEQTPASIHLWMSLVADLLPPGVVNIVNGFGVEAGKPLASSPRVAKVAFTGETTTGRLIMQYASENIKPVTLELGGKSPNLFFDDVSVAQDDFYDKALEGFTMFALNQGEVCTCPSRALIQQGHYSDFLAAAVARTEAIKQGHPLDTDTMVGAQASNDQLEKILSYLDIGRREGARVLTGGARSDLGGELAGGYYVQPTIFEGDNSMRIFQEEIFGPVVSVTAFANFADAIKIANDTLYGLGAGVWTRDMNTAYRAGRGIQAGRVWTNCYHAYPAHAAFGGYKQSGIGRENHKMMLEHYQQTKNLLVSYSPKKLGFF